MGWVKRDMLYVPLVIKVFVPFSTDSELRFC